jgi:hypothetical protein
MIEDKELERLSLLYQENAKVAAIFWEWRNKIITYFSTSIVALFTLAGWMYLNRPGRFISIPLFIGSILALVLTYLDERNGAILKASYKCGEDIEIELIKTKEGDSLVKTGNTIFKLIGGPQSVTYTKTLRYTLIFIAIVLGSTAIVNLICPKLL